MKAHPDDLTLLLHVRGDLDEVARVRIRRHAGACVECREALEELSSIDTGLRDITPTFRCADDEDLVFSPRDPFRARPPRPAGPAKRAAMKPERTLEVSRSAEVLAPPLVQAAVHGVVALRPALQGLQLSRTEDRLGLIYALDEALERMVERPACWLVFGETAATRARLERRNGRALSSETETLCPLEEVEGAASLVAGSACNWTGDLSRGGRALARAFRAFGHGLGLEPRLAQVEMAEAQRRSFVGRPAEGLRLADRAAGTFLEFGLDAFSARAWTARALALSYLAREEEAVAEFRRAQGEFERLALWNGWVSALNGAGYSLLKLGRLEEARREYARALRRVSRTENPAVHAFVRSNLAKTLLAAGRTDDAARGFSSAASLFFAQGAIVDGLIAMLGEVEARARGGDAIAAERTLGRVRARLERETGAGSRLLDSLEAVLAADRLDTTLLATHPEEASLRLREEPLALRGAG